MEQQQFDLIKHLKALWRFKWMIILVALVAGGTAWGFASTQPPVYEATVTMMVERAEPKLAALPTGPETGLEIAYLRDVASQIEVMKSRRVLERTVTKLEPEKASNPRYLQLEVEKLRDSLKIQQVGGTNLVALTVISSDPDVAQQKANAVAEAYVYEVRTTMTTAIQRALENSTERIEELGRRNVDLSNNPSLTRLTTQIDTALVALEAASEHLQQMGPGEAVVSPEKPASAVKVTGTMLTPLQLSTISQQIDAATSEANEISALAQQLKLQATERIFGLHGADIAVIERRTRELATKIGGLLAEVEAMRRAEIDPQVQGELLAVEEQLRVASTTGVPILEQVVELYAVEEQLRATGNMDPIPEEVLALYKAENANLLYRIVQHTDLLAAALKAASGQVQQIEPRAHTLESGSLMRWRLGVLGERAASTASDLRVISQQLQPRAPEGGVLLTHAELAGMETRARTVTTNLALLFSELQETRSDELGPEIYAELLTVQERVSVASGAVGALGDEIVGLAEGRGDGLSYAALENLRQELQLALLTMDSSGTRVVDAAMVSPTAGLFARYKSVILAVVAGLLLGVLSVLILQYFDRTVRDASQVTSYVGLPLMASVPRTKASENSHLPSVVMGELPQYLEAFRFLRTNLALDSCRGQVLLVTSPEEKEGKTTVAANLARAVALQGRAVLLIDGNLRKPDIAAAFNLAEGEGLTEFLTSEDEPSDYIKQAEGVDILLSGAPSELSAEMLSSPRMKAFLESTREIYDVVIVDSAPVMGCADTRILAKQVDEVLLVLKPDASKLDLARDSRQALETMGARVVGFALNKVGPNECNHLPHPADKGPQHKVDAEAPDDVEVSSK